MALDDLKIDKRPLKDLLEPEESVKEPEKTVVTLEVEHIPPEKKTKGGKKGDESIDPLDRLMTPVPLDVSRLTVLEDTKAKREITKILKNMDKKGVSLEDSVNLLVRAVVDHNVDLTAIRQAFKESIGGMADYIEMLMVGQTMKHLAAEVEASKQLDVMSQDMINIIRTPGKHARDRVAAFNALVKWRSERVDYPFKVARLIQDTRLVDRVMDIFQNFVKMSKSGSDKWEKMVADMPISDRRDMAIIVKSMVEVKNMDLKAVEKHLDISDEPDAAPDTGSDETQGDTE